tara:strand:- start:30 stop:368 length:339 start_codon:yes stop_codon:yes gene_type:complete
MNYLLLSVLGVTMFSNQQHQIFGEMIDMDTGEVILILPEKSEANKKFINSLNVWGKDNVSTITFEEFKNLSSGNNEVTKLGSSMNGIDSLSCSADGSCDGKVTLEKSTTKNY